MSLPNFENLVVELKDEAAFVTINRPNVLNALNLAVLNELWQLCHVLKARTDIRAMVLAGAGEKAFVAGADISQMRTMKPAEALAFAELGQRVTRSIEALPQVTIARVQGFALGGGCEIAMACDLIVASEQAKFGQPEINLGLIPGFGGTQRLVRRVGLSVGLDVLCAGRTLSGDEAFHLGLASRVCKAEELDAEINKTLKRILKGSPVAIAMTKTLARRAYDMSLDAGLAAEATAFATCHAHPDAADGMNAFIEKRSASFAR